MGYENEEFWREYKEYRLETNKYHCIFFNSFFPEKFYYNVLDLGCGREPLIKYYRVNPDFYTGVDKYTDEFGFKYDYIEESEKTYWLGNGLKIDTVVSLFSSELIIHPFERIKFYEDLFNKIGKKGSFLGLRNILVSGFYYENQKHDEECLVDDGLAGSSWSSLPILRKSDIFDEKVISMRVPSKMFGVDVVEVWRLMSRKVND